RRRAVMPPLAESQYAQLLDQRGTTLLFVGGLTVDHLLGLLAATTSRTDEVLGHFDDALTCCTGAGYRPELAWTNHDYANALLERDAPGDAQRALMLRDKAQAIATDLGLHTLTSRLQAPPSSPLLLPRS